ncbi:MAG: D-glycero-beta-D-manno-heptose-7-phosphate kinase [Ignavibacteriaceae bacterium]|nr:D-glycero-beta-D-manno-heptose-7-phosphate kinase [Ignavibacteriaceae bacterium]
MINKIEASRLEELRNAFEGRKIAVIGDMMLDCYITGTTKRISPEAPVPVVEIENEFSRFGGAANVALNIVKLGGVALPFGVIGEDTYADMFSDLLYASNISPDGLIRTKSRPTTAKTRIIAHHQHVVRIDKESTEPIDEETENRLFSAFENVIADVDGVILQDYNKGVLNEFFITKTIALAKKHNKLITVDPKFTNFFAYKDVTVFKPNRKEASDVLKMKIKTAEDVEKACSLLMEKLNAEYILLTLGEEGVAVFNREGVIKRMPTKARKVADVSGAGDTVISTLSIALSAGANMEEACYLANYAGGLVCEEVGIIPIEKDKLFTAVEED